MQPFLESTIHFTIYDPLRLANDNTRLLACQVTCTNINTVKRFEKKKSTSSLARQNTVSCIYVR